MEHGAAHREQGRGRLPELRVRRPGGFIVGKCEVDQYARVSFPMDSKNNWHILQG